jgi:hypothetical protein
MPTASKPRARIDAVLEINLSADDLVGALLSISKREPVFILDSCGVGHLGSHLLIAGLSPVQTLQVRSDSLADLDLALARGYAAIFTLSYEFGVQLQPDPFPAAEERFGRTRSVYRPFRRTHHSRLRYGQRLSSRVTYLDRVKFATSFSPKRLSSLLCDPTLPFRKRLRISRDRNMSSPSCRSRN